MADFFYGGLKLSGTVTFSEVIARVDVKIMRLSSRAWLHRLAYFVSYSYHLKHVTLLKSEGSCNLR